MNAVYNEFDNRKNLKLSESTQKGSAFLTSYLHEYYAYPLVIKT